MFIHGSSSDMNAGKAFEGIENMGARFVASGDGCFTLRWDVAETFPIQFDPCPPPSLLRSDLLKMGNASAEMSSDECVYEELVTRSGLSSKGGGTTENRIRAPLGLSRDGSPICLELGEGGPAHALVIGGTGSGKSSLLHLILTGILEEYPAEELEAYLVDLKGGVEFKRYAVHFVPNAKVVAIDCDREFAVSTLETVVVEMDRRMTAFRDVGSGLSSLPAYRKEVGPLPRILLVMDEFQKLFLEQDEFADRARSCFERLLKEGRGFGVHLLLVSQSLKGMVFRGGSLDQIGARIVLSCTAEDAALALAPGNTAGRELKSFHGVYNDLQGRSDANRLFKAAYLSPEEAFKHLDALEKNSGKAGTSTVIFEGARKIGLLESDAFRQADAMRASENSVSPTIFFGEPVAIRPAAQSALYPSRGRNMIALSKTKEEGTAAVLNSLLSLKITGAFDDHSPIIVNFLPPSDGCWLKEYLTETFPPDCIMESEHVMDDVLERLKQEVDRRRDSGLSEPPRFLCLFGLQYSKKLRVESVLGPPSQDTAAGKWLYLLREGPEVGIHQILWCDRLSNLSRCGRGILGECGIRISGALPRSDSVEFCGSSKAAMLTNPSRGILFDEDQPEQIQTFRPYRTPTPEEFQSYFTDLTQKDTYEP